AGDGRALRRSRRASGSRHLQHGSGLTFAQPRQQHDLPVGELERVVMRRRTVQIDLTKARQALADLLVRQQTDCEVRLAFDILVERDLSAREQTYGSLRIVDGR